MIREALHAFFMTEIKHGTERVQSKTNSCNTFKLAKIHNWPLTWTTNIVICKVSVWQSLDALTQHYHFLWNANYFLSAWVCTFSGFIGEPCRCLCFVPVATSEREMYRHIRPKSKLKKFAGIALCSTIFRFQQIAASYSSKHEHSVCLVHLAQKHWVELAEQYKMRKSKEKEAK